MQNSLSLHEAIRLLAAEVRARRPCLEQLTCRLAASPYFRAICTQGAGDYRNLAKQAFEQAFGSAGSDVTESLSKLTQGAHILTDRQPRRRILLVARGRPFWAALSCWTERLLCRLLEVLEAEGWEPHLLTLPRGRPDLLDRFRVETIRRGSTFDAAVRAR